MPDQNAEESHLLDSPRHLARIFGSSASQAASYGTSLTPAERSNVERMLCAASGKIGADPLPGDISPKLAADVMSCAAGTNDVVAAEYLAGALACGRIPPQEWLGVFLVETVRSLSAPALTGHYVVYKTWLRCLRNTPQTKAIFTPLLFVPRSEFARAVGARNESNLEDLDDAHLRELRERQFINKLSGPATRFMRAFPEVSEDGLLLTTTTQGQNLFISIYGSSSLTLAAMTETLVDVDSINLPECSGATLVPFPEPP